MKKKIILALLVTLVATLLLASCDKGGVTEPVIGPDKYVYTPGVLPTIVYNRELDKETQGSIYRSVKSAIGEAPYYGYDNYIDPTEHEIVFGKTSRSISQKAYRKLRLMQANTDYEVSYLIYASGNSVAIAYDEDVTGINKEQALNYFVDNYVSGKDSLLLNPGVVYSTTYSLLAYCEEIDAAIQAERWANLEAYLIKTLSEDENIGFTEAQSIAAAKEMMDAIRYHYSIYDSEMVLWLANLYEPFVCHCGECKPGTLSCAGGGFYFSNSARDNPGYLPDIESTAQALGSISSLGMTSYTGGGYAKVLPEWMKQQIVVFLRYLQDEDGYFRHPQWEQEYSQGPYASRLARDLGNAVSVLYGLDSGPRYNTPNGDAGDGGPVTPEHYLTSSVQSMTSVAANVSKVVASAEIVDWLKDLDSLKAYLDGLYNSQGSLGFYSIGNTMTSQMAQIVAQDRKLHTYGTENSMVKYVIDWFNMHQERVQKERAEQGLAPNGLWQVPTNYNAVNGLLKIIGVYNKAGVEMKYAEEATLAAIDAITSTEKVGAGVDLYNTWFAINGVLSNIHNYGTDRSLEGRLLARLYTGAPEAIRVSGDKMALFERLDHSFSYTPGGSTSTSQGMPTAIPGSAEGDVNGNVIASCGHIGNMYAALDIPEECRIPIYGHKELVMFLTELDGLGPVQKITGDDGGFSEPLHFDDDVVGDGPSGINASLKSSGSFATVIEDPRTGASGNVLHFVSNPGGGDSVNVLNTGSKTGTMQVFEGEFCVNTGTTHTYVTQIFIGQDAMLAIKIEGGKVCVYESTTGSNSSSIYLLLGKFDFGEWFKVKVEHFNGTTDTVRNKLYINDTLVAITDNYYGKDKRGNETTPKNGKLSNVQIYIMQDYKADIYMDNLNVYTEAQGYVIPTEGLENLVHNVDKDVVVTPVE